jgi:hypothetical protein
LFIGGLHRSGTSLVHRLIASHPSVSGFYRTGVPEDEGQHLQNLYPPARDHGGPGRFACDPAAHLTEESLDLVERCRAGLWDAWAPYWKLSRPVLVEKSPPNLIRARFLQAVFPKAKFIFVVRHPLAVAAATQKWSKQPIIELVQHWVRAHQVLLDDLPEVGAGAWVRYEDLIADPNRIVRELFDFIGISPIPPAENINDRNNAYLRNAAPIDAEITGREVMDRFGYRMEPPYYELAPGLGRVMSNVTEGQYQGWV